MQRDKRYKGIKSSIVTGSITEFRQIFDQVPKSLIAQDIRANNNRITKLIDYPELLTYEEILLLCDYLEIDHFLFIKIIDTQIAKQQKEPSHNGSVKAD